MCANAEVFLVGGENSAGQTAVFLANHAAKVHMLVRGPHQYLATLVELAPST